MKQAIITGASSGIGAATAKILNHQGYFVHLIARRLDRLQEVQKQLTDPQNSKIYSMDLKNTLDIENFFRNWQRPLHVLINNAGLARGAEPFQKNPWHEVAEVVQTNILSLMQMTHLALPIMQTQKMGTIVNIGSVAGRYVYRGGSVYCATKFAVRAFSEGLRMDLMGSGIRIINIEPGMVETEFSVVRFGDQQKADAVYTDMTPLTAEDIAANILWAIEAPTHVNIQELVIYPTDQAAIGQVHRGGRQK